MEPASAYSEQPNIQQPSLLTTIPGQTHSSITHALPSEATFSDTLISHDIEPAPLQASTRASSADEPLSDLSDAETIPLSPEKPRPQQHHSPLQPVVGQTKEPQNSDVDYSELSELDEAYESKPRSPEAERSSQPADLPLGFGSAHGSPRSSGPKVRQETESELSDLDQDDSFSSDEALGDQADFEVDPSQAHSKEDLAPAEHPALPPAWFYPNTLQPTSREIQKPHRSSPNKRTSSLTPEPEEDAQFHRLSTYQISDRPTLQSQSHSLLEARTSTEVSSDEEDGQRGEDGSGGDSSKSNNTESRTSIARLARAKRRAATAALSEKMRNNRKRRRSGFSAPQESGNDAEEGDEDPRKGGDRSDGSPEEGEEESSHQSNIITTRAQSKAKVEEMDPSPIPKQMDMEDTDVPHVEDVHDEPAQPAEVTQPQESFNDTEDETRIPPSVAAQSESSAEEDEAPTLSRGRRTAPAGKKQPPSASKAAKSKASYGGKRKKPTGASNPAALHPNLFKKRKLTAAQREKELDLDFDESGTPGLGCADSDAVVNHGGMDMDEDVSPGDSDVDEREDDAAAKHRKNGLEALFKIEIEFAKLRDRLYVERMEEVVKDREMVESGVHHELVLLNELIEKRRAAKLELASRTLQELDKEYDREFQSDENVIWAHWAKEKAALRAELLGDVNRKRRQLEREKRAIERPKDERLAMILACHSDRRTFQQHLALQGRPYSEEGLAYAFRRQTVPPESEKGLIGLDREIVAADLEQMGMPPRLVYMQMGLPVPPPSQEYPPHFFPQAAMPIGHSAANLPTPPSQAPAVHRSPTLQQQPNRPSSPPRLNFLDRPSHPSSATFQPFAASISPAHPQSNINSHISAHHNQQSIQPTQPSSLSIFDSKKAHSATAIPAIFPPPAPRRASPPAPIHSGNQPRTSSDSKLPLSSTTPSITNLGPSGVPWAVPQPIRKPGDHVLSKSIGSNIPHPQEQRKDEKGSGLTVSLPLTSAVS